MREAALSAWPPSELIAVTIAATSFARRDVTA
jgi:hypothetical protein